MKRSLKHKNRFYFVLFVVIISVVLFFNSVVFPRILRLSGDSSIKHASIDEVNLQNANKILGNIISEDTAIKNARNAINKENDVLTIFDIENSQVLSQYVYDNIIPNQSLWIIIFFNKYEDYTYEMPEDISPEMISKEAWETGNVWINQSGRIVAHYDYRTEYVIVEIDALSGEYHGYETAYAEYKGDEKNVVEWLNKRYNTNFKLETD